MITKDMLEKLRAERARPRYENQLTPHGYVVAQVHSELEHKREKFITQGERTLQEALEDFRREQKLAATRGLGTREFNAHVAGQSSNQPEKPMAIRQEAASPPQTETITLHRISTKSMLEALQQHRNEQAARQAMNVDAHSHTQHRSIEP